MKWWGENRTKVGKGMEDERQRVTKERLSGLPTPPPCLSLPSSPSCLLQSIRSLVSLIFLLPFAGTPAHFLDSCQVIFLHSQSDLVSPSVQSSDHVVTTT